MASQITESTAKNVDFATVLVDRDTLAKFFNCSDRTVLRLAKEFGMPKAARNQFRLLDCVQWYIQHLIADRSAGGDDESLSEERKLLIRVQRQRHELEIAKRRGELVDAEAMGAVLGEMSTIFARYLETLPQRMSHRVAVMTDQREINDLLAEESRAIRTAVSAAITDYAATYDSGGDSVTPPAAQRRRVGRPAKNAPA